MKNRIISLLTVSFLIFVFVIFYKSLKETNLYTPKLSLNKDIPEFETTSLFDGNIISTNEIFNEQKIYLLNIWASWCIPCRDEHPLLMRLSVDKRINILGLNYKDNFDNAKKFINELGNPYSQILLDKDGTKAIEWGAFGVPESYLIHNNKIVLKFVGPINSKSLEEIRNFIK